MRNYTFDFMTKTIVVTKGFYTEACKPDTEEHHELTQLMSDYPNWRLTVRRVNTSNRKSDTKGLTYKYMRRFISVMDEDNLQTFEKIILHYEFHEEDSAAVYHHVKEWFLATYPRHKEMIVEAEPQAVVRAAA